MNQNLTSVQSTGSHRGIFTIGRWSVDVSGGSISDGNEDRHLEPQVMRVLAYFADNAGRVIPKRELLDTLWPGVIVEEAALIRCVSQIRRALGDSAKRPQYVETVPKSGYRLIAPVQRRRTRVRRSLAKRYAAAAMLVLALAVSQVGTTPIKSAGELVHNNPLATEAYTNGLRNYDVYRYEENENAIALFRRALEIDPDFGLAYAGLANALAQRVLNYDGVEKEAALALATRAVQLAPDRAESHKAYGLALSLHNDLDGALLAYQKALRIDPSLWQAAYNSALIHRRRLHLPEAEAAFLHVLHYVPGHNRAKSELGDVYLRQGNVEQAANWLNLALHELPVQLSATTRRAILDVTIGNRGTAVEQCMSILRQFGNDYDCLRTITVAALIDEDLETAQDAVALLLEGWPGDRYASLGLAQIHMAKGRTDEARQIISEVIRESKHQLRSQDRDWYDYWVTGAAFALQGNQTAALECLEQAGAQGYRFPLWDAIEPAFSRLKDNSRFDRYLGKTENSAQTST